MRPSVAYLLTIRDGNVWVCEQSVFADDVASESLEEKRGSMSTPRSQRLKSTIDMEKPELENTFEVDVKVNLSLARCRHQMFTALPRHFLTQSIETYKENKLCEKLQLVFEYYHVYTPPPCTMLHTCAHYLSMHWTRARITPLSMHWIIIPRAAKTFKVQHFKLGLLPKVGKSPRVGRQCDCCRRLLCADACLHRCPSRT